MEQVSDGLNNNLIKNFKNNIELVKHLNRSKFTVVACDCGTKTWHQIFKFKPCL